jgi:hypothetical protein
VFASDFAAFGLDELVKIAEEKAAAHALDKSAIKDFTESSKYERTKAHNDEFNASGGKRTKKPTPASPTATATTAKTNSNDSTDDDDDNDSAEEAGETTEGAAIAVDAASPLADSADVLGTSPPASKLERLLSRSKGAKPGAKSPPPPSSATSTCEEKKTQKIIFFFSKFLCVLLLAQRRRKKSSRWRHQPSCPPRKLVR